MDVLMFPGFDLYSYLRNEPWPPGPALFFAQSFIYAILNSTSGIVAFLWLHRKAPRAMDPGTPGYDTAAAREYGGWRSVDMPLYATLCIITAVLIVVNCAAWLRWDLERKRLAARAADVELRDMRLRRMFQMGGAEGREEKTVLGAEPSREGGQRGRMSE
ncbi:hypothetical protein IMZ48_05915 [Candidatus Bathyarchaeota archaeon]|nr:hypothetical protein [Candidatus Bathyarchaeota archaeon]